MSSARMASAGERFLRTKKAQKALADWAGRLIGRRIVKITWDYRNDDTLAIQITLDNGQQFLGPSAAEYLDDIGRFEVI